MIRQWIFPQQKPHIIILFRFLSFPIYPLDLSSQLKSQYSNVLVRLLERLLTKQNHINFLWFWTTFTSLDFRSSFYRYSTCIHQTEQSANEYNWENLCSLRDEKNWNSLDKYLINKSICDDIIKKSVLYDINLCWEVKRSVSQKIKEKCVTKNMVIISGSHIHKIQFVDTPFSIL